jgi:hypothetical protein
MLADLLRKGPATVAAETLAAALTLGRDHSWRDSEADLLLKMRLQQWMIWPKSM